MPHHRLIKPHGTAYKPSCRWSHQVSLAMQTGLTVFAAGYCHRRHHATCAASLSRRPAPTPSYHSGPYTTSGRYICVRSGKFTVTKCEDVEVNEVVRVRDRDQIWAQSVSALVARSMPDATTFAATHVQASIAIAHGLHSWKRSKNNVSVYYLAQ